VKAVGLFMSLNEVFEKLNCKMLPLKPKNQQTVSFCWPCDRVISLAHQAQIKLSGRAVTETKEARHNYYSA
jgi:hypothetical protein